MDTEPVQLSMNTMNKYIVALIGILLISLVIAQSLINTSKTIDKDKLSLIKSVNNLSDVNVQISDIVCTDNKCKTNVYLENIIDKEIGLNRFKCIEKNTRERCIKRAEKTENELRNEIDNIILDELDNYAEKINKEDIKSGGVLNIK